MMTPEQLASVVEQVTQHGLADSNLSRPAGAFPRTAFYVVHGRRRVWPATCRTGQGFQRLSGGWQQPLPVLHPQSGSGKRCGHR